VLPRGHKKGGSFYKHPTPPTTHKNQKKKKKQKKKKNQKKKKTPKTPPHQQNQPTKRRGRIFFTGISDPLEELNESTGRLAEVNSERRSQHKGEPRVEAGGGERRRGYTFFKSQKGKTTMRKSVFEAKGRRSAFFERERKIA